MAQTTYSLAFSFLSLIRNRVFFAFRFVRVLRTFHVVPLPCPEEDKDHGPACRPQSVSHCAYEYVCKEEICR